MLRTWLAAPARRALLARTGARCQAALMRSTRQSVAAPMAVELSAVGTSSAPRHERFVEAAVSVGRAGAPKIAAHRAAAAVNNGLRGLFVSRAPPDRVRAWVQARRTDASPGRPYPAICGNFGREPGRRERG